MRRNCDVPTINTMMIMEMKGRRGFANPNANRRGGFPNPNEKDSFFNSIHGKGGGYSNFDEFGVPSFNENLDFELSLLWIDKVDKLFYMKYIPMEDYVEFVAYKLKGRTAT